MKRCDWCEGDELYIEYHDKEWGVPVYDDRVHFEFLLLESMQAGLSWITILKKRENFRKAFDNFDYEKIAKYDERKIDELMNNKGIIRNKLKIKAAVNNAKKFIDIENEFGSFNSYIWAFTDGKSIITNYERVGEIPTKSELSKQISKDLQNRGFKFLGPIIMHSYLNATGIIDDHIKDCFRKGNIDYNK